MYINETLAAAFNESELLSNEISIKDALGEGSLKLGLFAERIAAFEDWSYSTAQEDVAKYGR